MEQIYAFDFGILGFIRDNLASPAGDVIMKIITYSGSGGAVWIAVAICLLLSRKRERKNGGIMIFAALVLTLIINILCLKNLIARPRPFIADPAFVPAIPPPAGYSFPSGHSCSSFACAIVLHRQFEKRPVRLAAWGMAGLIAFSRLYFYVHFPTDVLAGAVMGAAIGYLAVFTVRRMNEKQNGISNRKDTNL